MTPEQRNALMTRIGNVRRKVVRLRNEGLEPRCEEISDLCAILAELVDFVARCSPTEPPESAPAAGDGEQGDVHDRVCELASSERVEPLKPGRIALHIQAAVFGVDVPVGKTVAEIKAAGFDVDPDWAEDAVMVAHPNSPTGYVVRRRLPVSSQQHVWALAT